MPKIYYLSTCSTCARIMKDLKISPKNFELQDIKTEPITGKQLDEMKKLAGSYEALFSRVALKYRALGLNNMTLGENDYKKYILQEYTFLKRPVMLIDGKIFIGNTKKVLEEAAKTIKSK
jgi:arsenate reductase